LLEKYIEFLEKNDGLCSASRLEMLRDEFKELSSNEEGQLESASPDATAECVEHVFTDEFEALNDLEIMQLLKGGWI
jgi:hypothetical protein